MKHEQYHPLLRFNNNNVSQASSQKHLGLTLDNRLTFNEHLTNVSNKISTTIGLLRKLRNILPRPALMVILFMTRLTTYRSTKN